MPEKLTHTVDHQEAGLTVGTLLRRHFALSGGLLRRLKQVPGGITLDGHPVTVRTTVRAGQLLAMLTEGKACVQTIVPVAGPLDILFEDGQLLLVNKPAGLPVHPSRGHYLDTLANRVVAYLGATVPFRAVNRLDSGTGGVICLAKSGLSAQRLGAQLAARQIGRRYIAVVEGVLSADSGTVAAPIARVPGRGIMRQVDPAGQEAVTHFRVEARGGVRTRVALELETGRTHQIRVHMAQLGHPVTGDFMYGTELPGLTGHALHAARLEMRHPISGEALAFEAPVPGYFDELLSASHSTSVHN